jgi:hypothetical protein
MDTGTDVNADNALQAALSGNYDKIVQMLMDMGIDINT